MGAVVVQGAVLACTFGTAPGTLIGTSQSICMAGGKPVATIQDVGAYVHIAPFGMCTSMANPQVAAATAAALGVLAPQPCMLAAAGTWILVKPGILTGGIPCLCSESQLFCGKGMGMISIKSPGQMKVLV